MSTINYIEINYFKMRTIYQLIISFLLQFFVANAIAQNITATIGSVNSSSCAIGDTLVIPITTTMANNLSVSSAFTNSTVPV